MSLPVAHVLKEPVLWVMALNRALNKELIKDVKAAQGGREQHILSWHPRTLNKLLILRKNSWVGKMYPKGEVYHPRLFPSALGFFFTMEFRNWNLVEFAAEINPLSCFHIWLDKNRT